MSPTLPEILTGVVVALSEPPAPEDAGAFTQGRLGVLAMLSVLAAQEAERGPAADAWENATLRSLCREHAAAYDAALDGALTRAAEAGDGEGALTSLRAANADLRRALITLHAAAESRGDDALDRRILALYREMAAARMLHLPGTG